MKKSFDVFLMTLWVVLMMARVCVATEWMTDEELKSLLGGSQVVVIDLRTAEEWKGSSFKVPDAVHEDPADVTSWAAKYSREAIIVLYCS